jgi:DNA repair protein RadC
LALEVEMKRNQFSAYSNPIEFKIVPLRECPVAQGGLAHCEKPNQAVDYWRAHVENTPLFNPECECLVVLILDTRLRIKGHQMVGVGTMNSVLTHAREIFRGAILASAFGVVLLHNHPSGDPTPSDTDIKVTRDVFRAGELLKIDLLDHIIVGAESHVSLRELGYLYK